MFCKHHILGSGSEPNARPQLQLTRTKKPRKQEGKAIKSRISSAVAVFQILFFFLQRMRLSVKVWTVLLRFSRVDFQNSAVRSAFK